MFRRIKASLASPSQISSFRKDNIGLVLLYIICLCFLVSIPTLIKSVKRNGIPEQTKLEIRSFLVENRNNLPKGTIENNTLTITEQKEGFYLGDVMAIEFPTDDIEPIQFASQNIYYVLRINDHNVELYFLGNKIKTATYTELGLDGFDLAFVDIADYKTRTLEFERIEHAMDSVFNDIKPMWVTINVVAVFVKTVFITLILDLVFAFLSLGIRGLTFKEIYVIILYSFVVEIIGRLFDELYGLDFCAYIGVILGIIYYVIALRSMTVFRIEDK